MNKVVKKEIDLAGRKLSLETGVFAPLANMAVLAKYGETVVLVTAVSVPQAGDVDFFPLRVDYQEKLYAGGLIKSSRFVKREGRPSDDATITARLMDHAIRPLFPKDFMDEVQIVATVLSIDQDNDPEVISLIAVSAALHASDIPWKGPMATCRVGLKENDSFIYNPTFGELEKSLLDIVVSTVPGDKVLAMEAGIKILPEEKVLSAIKFANDNNKVLLDFIDGFAKEVGSEKHVYLSSSVSKKLLAEVRAFAGKEIKEYVSKPCDKKQVEEVSPIKESILAEFGKMYSKRELLLALDTLEKEYVRDLILTHRKRPDGRKLDEIRPMDIQLSVLPRTHGSAFFRRGLTQTLTITTLGSSSLEQLIQNMYGEESKRYIHHYYGPSYSLGEVGPLGSPGRREIGHGALAEKALLPVIPGREEFPYTIRVVSEILSQNGSSSMAATCGSTLSLMDAGVPIKAPIAGIAIGLIADKDEKNFVVLTDIAGVEDFNGFMDFKMTGSREGITAIQMDIKLTGIPLSLLDEIFERSKKARGEILDLIDKAISRPRSELSKYAPKVDQIRIKQDQMGIIIGSGGRTIRDIMAKSGATVDVSESGDGETAFVAITAPDVESIKKARTLVEGLVREIKVGEVYDGTVKRVTDFGAIVELVPGKEGLLHVSEISYSYVANPSDFLKVGDVVKVKVIKVDIDGKISLSKKALSQPRPMPKGPRFGGDGSGGNPYFGRRDSGYKGRGFVRRPRSFGR